MRGEGVKLSARQAEILPLLADGLSNTEIGAKLYVSHGTVATHVQHMLMKFEARSRAHMVHRAHQEGLL